VIEWLASLPEWLVFGTVLGIGCSLGVAGLFVLVARLFPTRRTPQQYGDTESRRQVEIRAYLDRIDEPYAEDHPVAGQPVAFYLPERDVAITFDARAYFRITNTGMRAILVEHELPGVAIGTRLPFETPDERTVSSHSTHPVRTAFATLGLPAGAPLEEVTSAYRSKVKDVHPDHGGDEDDFKRVREAYTTAKQHAT
jgi:hypothetical protein